MTKNRTFPRETVDSQPVTTLKSNSDILWVESKHSIHPGLNLSELQEMSLKVRINFQEIKRDKT